MLQRRIQNEQSIYHPKRAEEPLPKLLIQGRSSPRLAANQDADSMMSLRAEAGTYAIHLHAHREEHIRVGRLGSFAVEQGIYLYAGSAFDQAACKPVYNDMLAPPNRYTGTWITSARQLG